MNLKNAYENRKIVKLETAHFGVFSVDQSRHTANAGHLVHEIVDASDEAGNCFVTTRFDKVVHVIRDTGFLAHYEEIS